MEIGEVGDDHNQCIDRGEREIDYRVDIVGDPAHLTPQGFVIDRNEVPAYFHRKYGVYIDVLPSCERMALDAAKDIAALCGEAALEVRAWVGGAYSVWRKDS